jgi:flavin reductase (DIM6/NTAB) family NADH-FMN oxidoreductase RutF
VPVVEGVRGWVAGPVIGRYDVGDHVAFVIDVEAGAVEEPTANELGFQAVKDLEPGHEP